MFSGESVRIRTTAGSPYLRGDPPSTLSDLVPPPRRAHGLEISVSLGGRETDLYLTHHK